MRLEPGSPFLEVDDLRVETPDGVRLLDGISFRMRPDEVLGLVGPSGSGKSLTALSIVGLLPPRLRRTEGRILWRGEDLAVAPADRLRRLRGREIGIVFQEAQSALHPCHRVGDQIAEALRLGGSTRGVSAQESLERLRTVGVPEPASWGPRYPHEWSGGMRQRALIAMALANAPALLIADEPTSALDVTIQAQIMALLSDIRRQRGLGVLVISHDLGLVAEHADRVVVVSGGRVVEHGEVGALFSDPRNPVTRELVAASALDRPAAPKGRSGPASSAPPLLEVREVSVRIGAVPAVREVSLDVREGECVAVVGESGCGKSTLARAVIGLESPGTGSVLFGGVDIRANGSIGIRRVRRAVQMVFQDAAASFNPRRSIGWSVARPIAIHERVPRAELRARVEALLDRVGLPRACADRRPHTLSGGERQRAAIARALAVRPRLLVLDEPFSALDSHRRGELTALLARLRDDLGLSFLLISHDLGVVRALADRVYVVYLGRVVESGPALALLDAPRHPYTRALTLAEPGAGQAPAPSGSPWIVPGEVPDPLSPPSGCSFRTRCPSATELCSARRPELRAEAPLRDVGTSTSGRRDVACHHPLEPGSTTGDSFALRGLGGPS